MFTSCLIEVLAVHLYNTFLHIESHSANKAHSFNYQHGSCL